MDKREQQFKKESEILANFSEDFKRKVMTQPMASQVFHSLVAGVNPHVIIEHLLDANQQQHDQMVKFMEHQPLMNVLKLKGDEPGGTS